MRKAAARPAFAQFPGSQPISLVMQNAETIRLVSPDGKPADFEIKESAVPSPGPGEVVTRTALYEHLFDEADDSLSNVLEVHVSNLRKKLGHDLIATRRGLGYSIP